MPHEVLDAAKTYVAPQALEAEVMLDEIARERAAAEDARARALKEAADAATLKVRARAALKDAERKHQQIWQEATTAAEEELAELRREAHRLRLQLQSARERAPAQEAIEAALTLPAFKAPPAPVAPEPEPEPSLPASVALGAEVVVPRLGLPGRVTAIRDDDVEVDVMGRRVRMNVRDLEGATKPTAAERREVERPMAVALAAPRGDVPLQLDLRGLRRDEALERLHEYLLEAAQVGLPNARIVHGKGTGAIRQAVREALRGSSYVSRFEAEKDQHGGDGATQVWLK
jgi:DNA mismatch repair protein MutS2